MDNIVKFLYCMHLGDADFKHSLMWYARFINTNVDARSLKMGFVNDRNGLQVKDREDTISKLVFYLMHKDECRVVAKRRWEQIRDITKSGEEWVDDSED